MDEKESYEKFKQEDIDELLSESLTEYFIFHRKRHKGIRVLRKNRSNPAGCAADHVEKKKRLKKVETCIMSFTREKCQ